MSAVEAELRDGRFVVRTRDDAFRDALRALGFADEGGAFTRSGDAETYPRFAASLRRMLLQLTDREPVPWEDALEDAARRLDGADWFLSGSAGLAVRGVALEPHDLDLVVSDADRAAAAFADVLVEPVSRNADGEWIARSFGRAFLAARVEWAAEVFPSVDARPNEFGPRAAASVEQVRWRGREIAVPSVEIQLEANRARGLDDRVRALVALG